MSRIVTGSTIFSSTGLAVVAAAIFALATFGPATVGLGQGPAALGVASPANYGTANPGLITLTQPAGDKYQQLVVIDPVKRCVAVYHVELATGKIALKSTRNVHWDFELYAFNTEDPQPTEIRGLLNKQ